ncbi:MAG: hypothetical protein JNM39_13325 [Bdellovibrionaceae bacterium]|nr:hypothetical protein [Pseudobdellovibrionaceae bacterium]
MFLARDECKGSNVCASEVEANESLKVITKKDRVPMKNILLALTVSSAILPMSSTSFGNGPARILKSAEFTYLKASNDLAFIAGNKERGWFYKFRLGNGKQEAGYLIRNNAPGGGGYSVRATQVESPLHPDGLIRYDIPDMGKSEIRMDSTYTLNPSYPEGFPARSLVRDPTADGMGGTRLFYGVVSIPEKEIHLRQFESSHGMVPRVSPKSGHTLRLMLLVKEGNSTSLKIEDNNLGGVIKLKNSEVVSHAEIAPNGKSVTVLSYDDGTYYRTQYQLTKSENGKALEVGQKDRIALTQQEIDKLKPKAHIIPKPKASATNEAIDDIVVKPAAAGTAK